MNTTNPQTNHKDLRYFVYARKSTERDERQAHSIEDQLAEVWRLVEREGLNVVGEFTESKSARTLGRPVFADMLARIEAGEADAIVAWHPDRLARNAVDGGSIIYLLDSGKLKHLSFVNSWFENTSQGKYMLGLAFAQSKYYTDNLSENVRRGVQARIKAGIYPGKAKRGYLNHPKTKEIIPDPVYFPLIRQAYELYLTGRYPLGTLSQEMYRRGFKNLSGRPLLKQQVVWILTDPFYYGAFVWLDELYQGIHQPAVEKRLWDRVQKLYRSRSRPQSRCTPKAVFCGLMRCSECGCAITAEDHSKHMKSGKVHTWVYYRCTKKRNIPCTQPYVRQEVVLSEFMNKLEQIALPDDWALPMLAQIEAWAATEDAHTKEQVAEVDAESKKIEAQLRRLLDLMIEGDLDRAQYRARKEPLINNKIALIERRKKIAQEGGKYWLEPLRALVNEVWERNLPTSGGDLLKLRDFVAKVGSNHCVNSGKVLWDWISPYALLAERFGCSGWLADVDEFRNWLTTGECRAVCRLIDEFFAEIGHLRPSGNAIDQATSTAK